MFRRKVPASQGLLKVAASNVLMTLDLVENSDEALAIGALVARHVAEAAEGVGALPNVMADFDEHVWAAICAARPALASRRVTFCAFYLKAHSLVRQANNVSIVQAFYEAIAMQRGCSWKLSLDEYRHLTKLALEAAAGMIVDHRHGWKREIA